MRVPWFVYGVFAPGLSLCPDCRVVVESPDLPRRPAVDSSETQPAIAGARTSALGDSRPQVISRSCPGCSLRHYDRVELNSPDLVRQRGLRPVSGGRLVR